MSAQHGRIIKHYAANGYNIRIEARTFRVLYSYKASGMGVSFDLLSHVGAPYQQGFRDIIARYGLQIELYDNPQDTYAGGYYERIKHDCTSR